MTFAESVERAIADLRLAGFSTSQAVLGIHMAVECVGQRIEREDARRAAPSDLGGVPARAGTDYPEPG